MGDTPYNNDARALTLAGQGQLQDRSNPIRLNAITIDRNREGWENTVPYPPDPAEDVTGTNAIDWITITLANDCDDFFVRYELSSTLSFTEGGSRYNILVDTDRSRSTGFIGFSGGFTLPIGADVLFAGGVNGEKRQAFVFAHNGAGQTEWDWRPIHYYSYNELASGTKRDIEWKLLISDLNITNTDVISINWVAWADNKESVYDFYPDRGNLEDGDFHTYTFNVSPSLTLFPNPERGFYEPTETHSDHYTPLNRATLKCYRENEGTTLIHRMFYLENFVDSPITEAYTTAMTADFETVRQAGLKMIVRFAYADTPHFAPGTYWPPIPPYGDSTKEWILTHTEQLSPVLQANSDVIAAMQVGFIGLWGEWYYTDHLVQDPWHPERVTPQDYISRGQVLTATLAALPITRMVQLRTPRYKQNIFNRWSPITRNEGYDDSNIARTGHHNDCFLASDDDYGTYVSPTVDYPYLASETMYLPMGGETCNPNPPRSKCQKALDELGLFHWSYMNIDYHPDVLASWRESCFITVGQKLGYRFALSQTTFPDQVSPGADLEFKMQIENEGYAAPFNPRPMELILRQTDAPAGSTYTFKLSDDERLDGPRGWLPGEIHIISSTISVPITLPVGKYEVLLNLPDPVPSLRYKPEYAVRLVGADWEPSTGYNSLDRTLIVTYSLYLPAILKNN
jgi:hypothetical protein